MDRPSRRFRASFPVQEEPGFRTGAWVSGVPGFGDQVKLFSKTTVEALRFASTEAAGVRFYPEDEKEAPIYASYAELLDEVRSAAGYLRARGVGPHDRVLIVLPTSLEFVVAFLAAQWLGAIPVPSYPPPALERLETALDRLAHIGSRSRARFLVTSAALRPVLGDVARRVSSIERVILAETLGSGDPVDAAPLDPEDPCFIQYTSGSTGHPKGVLLTHANVTSSIHAMGLAVETRRGDSLATWCPLYHDMGLIGGLLYPLYWGIPLALTSPLAFLSRPLRWLQMIAENRSTISMGPNFAYALVVRRSSPEERARLDLSSWRIALNGAEPVNARTVEEFVEAMAPAGFRPDAIFPSYGLAEASLGVTFPRPGSPLRTMSVDRAALANGYVVESEREGSMRIVGCGDTIPGHQVLIVDESGNPVERGQVGHIVVRGPAIMRGYFEDAAATEKVLRDGSLWTGDLGFRDDGVLFVTGRAKDLIIVRGKNYYAEDVERCLERVEGVRSGGGVAFAVYDDERAKDAVIAVCETKVMGASERQALVEELTRAVADECGLALEEVVLVEQGAVPKTSSGKKQRALTRERYLVDDLVSRKTGRLGVASVFVRSAVGFLALATRRAGGSRRPQDTD